MKREREKRERGRERERERVKSRTSKAKSLLQTATSLLYLLCIGLENSTQAYKVSKYKMYQKSRVE